MISLPVWFHLNWFLSDLLCCLFNISVQITTNTSIFLHYHVDFRSLAQFTIYWLLFQDLDVVVDGDTYSSFITFHMRNVRIVFLVCFCWTFTLLLLYLERHIAHKIIISLLLVQRIEILYPSGRIISFLNLWLRWLILKCVHRYLVTLQLFLRIGNLI